jgi:hypothetical protein
VRPGEAGLLDQRAAVRAEYGALLAQAGDWQVPASIRAALDSWRFDDAHALIATAQTVLTARLSLEQEAAAAGVRLPDRLRAAFEAAGGPSSAVVELNVEHEVIADIAAAGQAALAPRDTLAAVGLMGSEPDTALADARAAFAAGNLDLASRNAVAVSDIYGSAEQTGRSRAISALAALASVSFLVAALARQFRRRRRPHAHRVGGGTAGSADPYATLALDPNGTGALRGPSATGPDAVSTDTGPAGSPDAGAADDAGTEAPTAQAEPTGPIEPAGATIAETGGGRPIRMTGDEPS